MNILVIRFRQMGDAILATALLNTLRHNFPDAQIHFVLNERIAPLFEGHPSIDRIITFTDDERHSALTYMRKVWRTVHDVHYDVIIDMRSTMNTMLFSMFSRGSKYRIGVNKGYSWLAFNRKVARGNEEVSMVERNVSFAEPLSEIKKIVPVREFTLSITEREYCDFADYLVKEGIDMTRPVMLANVTAKLASKVWSEDNMVWVLEKFMREHPDWQIIFNYAPGQEEANARRIYERLGKPEQVFIDVKARSSRELVAMGRYMTCFFGNEGGARHIMHAAGCPSLVVCAPGNSKKVWIPQTNIVAEGISPADFMAKEELATMDREAQYALVKKETVWQRLNEFVRGLKP